MSTYLADEACAMTVGQLVSYLVPYLPLIPETAVTMTIEDDWALIEWDRVIVLGDDGRPEIDGDEIRTAERHGQVQLRVDAVSMALDPDSCPPAAPQADEPDSDVCRDVENGRDDLRGAEGDSR